MDNEEIQREDQRRIKAQLPKSARGRGEEEWVRMREIVVKEATEVCGKTSAKVREKGTPWWNYRVKQP